MAQETNQTQAPLLCSTGCGFYGNPRTNGMCSICYKDFLQRQNTNGRVAESVSVPAASSSLSSLDESLSAPSSRVSPVSTLEQSSSQSLVKSAEVTEVEDASAEDEAKTQGASCSAAVASVQQNHPLRAGGSVEASASRGKRKLEEILQLDGESASGSDAPSQPPADESGKSKPRKNRCYTCRKKVGLTGFDCRCGNLFCGVHRYSDIHNCSFDYKADAAEKIRKENPVVVGEKIAKI